MIAVIRMTAIALVLGIQTVAAPDLAGAGQPADAVISVEVLSVKNNTSVPLTCAEKWRHGSWGAWFTIAPAQEWTESFMFGGAEMQCTPPVRQVRYSLEGGKRYRFLRAPDGHVELVEVATSGD